MLCIVLFRLIERFDGDAAASFAQARCRKVGHCSGRTCLSGTDVPKEHSRWGIELIDDDNPYW